MRRVIVAVLICLAGLAVIGAVALSSIGVGSGNAFRPDSGQVDKLSKTEVFIDGNQRAFGPASMEMRDGIYVTHLQGTPYEIGFQHGRILQNEINHGSARFYADVIYGGRQMPFSIKIWLLRKYLDWKVYGPLYRHQPKSVLEELKGISDGSGVPFDIIFKANHHTGPSMVLTPAFARKNIEAFDKLGIRVGACSTFAAVGKAAAGGVTVVGRNTDYGGVALWPKYQTVSFIKPSEGYAHVKIGTAGVILWNPAMNTEGIVTCPHLMVYDDISADGWSIPAFSDEIIRKAGTLKEAEMILNDNPRAVSGGYVIISGKEKDAFAAELGTSKATIRRMDNDRIAMTNMAVTKEKRAVDITVRYNIMEHCPGRYRRLMELVDKNYGAVGISQAAAFMGDHIQYATGLERATGHVLGVSDNENSMVFSPETLEFWVADGPAPVCNNVYKGFSLSDELAGKKSSVNPPVLEGYRFQNPSLRAGLDIFMKAFALKENDPDRKEEIIRLIGEAWKEDPGEVTYGRLLALYDMHDGRYDEALAIMENVLNLKQSFRELCHARLIAGMLCDLKGNRQKAMGHYTSVMDMKKDEPEDPWFGMNRFLFAFAEKYSRQPFTKKDLSDQSANIEFIDPYME